MADTESDQTPHSQSKTSIRTTNYHRCRYSEFSQDGFLTNPSR